VTIGALAISGNNVYAGGIPGGILVSTDNGVTWRAKNGSLMFSTINNLVSCGSKIFATSSNNQSMMMSSLNGGIFMSVNNGTTWSEVWNDNSYIAPTAITSNGSNVFAAAGRMFLQSSDGTTWEKDSITFQNNPITFLAVSDSIIYAGTSTGRIFTSSIGALSWIGLNSINLSSSNSITGITKCGANIIAGLSTDGVYLSSNNGLSWQPSNYGLSNLHITCLASYGTSLFACAQSVGVFISTNNGTSWTPANSGLPGNITVGSLILQGSNLFAATNSGVFLSTNNATSWTAVDSGLSAINNMINCLAVSDSNIYAGTTGSGVWLRSLSEMVGVIYKIPQHRVLNQANFQIHELASSNSSLSIEFSIPHSGHVAIKVYNLLGREVVSLVNVNLGSGSYRYIWNSRSIAEGRYTVKMQTGSNAFAKSIAVAK
jgi:hypothetical protein